MGKKLNRPQDFFDSSNPFLFIMKISGTSVMTLVAGVLCMVTTTPSHAVNASVQEQQLEQQGQMLNQRMINQVTKRCAEEIEEEHHILAATFLGLANATFLGLANEMCHFHGNGAFTSYSDETYERNCLDFHRCVAQKFFNLGSAKCAQS